MRTRRARERGQVIPVVVLFLIVFTGFVGIVVDGGIGYTHQRHDQDVADGAALAGAYQLYSTGTLAQAQAVANHVAQLDGCASPCSLAPLTWYDAGGTLLSGSPSPLTVARVGASVLDTATTNFAHLDPAGNRIVIIAASAQALVQSNGLAGGIGGTHLNCVICDLGLLTISAKNNALTSGSGNIRIDGYTTITSSGITLTATTPVGVSPPYAVNLGGGYNGGNGTVISPSPYTTVAGTGDPMPPSKVPSPTWTGLSPQVPSISGANVTMVPGIYNSLTFTSGQQVNFSPGIYVLTGTGITIAQQNVVLTGTGVTLYFVCGLTNLTPSLCAAAGQSGASLLVSANGALFNLSAPTTGAQGNILMYFDPHNTGQAGIGVNVTAQNFGGTATGTLYMPSAQLNISAKNTGVFASPIVVGSIVLSAQGNSLGNLSGLTIVPSPGGLSK